MLIQELSVEQRIRAAFKELNDYELHQSVINEIIYMAYSPNAEQCIHKSPPFPGMPRPAHPSHWKSCSLNTASMEITKIKSAVKNNELQKALEKIHQPTIHALNEAGFYNQKFDALFPMSKIIDRAAIIINQWKKDYPSWKSKKSGQPKKEIPFHVAMILGDEYHKATGGDPTISVNPYIKGNKAYGSFFELVKKVFDALEIKASPEAMIKAVIELRHKRKEALEDGKARLKRLQSVK